MAVILSEAKNLALRIFMNMRDSSSPAAPQNDTAYEFFRSLLRRPLRKAKRVFPQPAKASPRAQSLVASNR
jgi:hypothetical protein